MSDKYYQDEKRRENEKNEIILNETHRPDGSLATRTFEIDGKKFIDQYDSKGKVIAHIDLTEKDKIVYDDEGIIKSHIIAHNDLDFELVEYDTKGKEKRRLDLKTTDDHAYTSSKAKSFEKGMAKLLSGTKFEKALQNLFLGYLIIHVATKLETGVNRLDLIENFTFPGPVAGAKNNVIGNIEIWENKTSNNEEIMKMKNFVLYMDWASFAAQNKNKWHPACDTGIRSYLPHLNGSTLESYKDKGWDMVEKAYKEIDGSLSGFMKIKTTNLIQKNRD